MDGKFFQGRNALTGRFRLPPDRRSISGAVLFFLLLGVLSGCVFGLYSTARLPCCRALPEDGVRFAPVLLQLSVPFLTLLFFSGSFYGIVLAPVIMLLCGFCVGDYVAQCFTQDAYYGLLDAFLRAGPVMLLLLPCLTLWSADCFLASGRLLKGRFGRGVRPQLPAFGTVHVLLACALLVLCTFYVITVYPLLFA